jgi:oxygen-independent coproporphyrinogen-3 oxidase
MMEQAAQLLRQRGFVRYEVASYAKPGYECRHNSAYWSGVPYLGLGKGAAGMRQNARCRERLFEGRVVETLTPSQALAEDLMLAMRMSTGVAMETVEVAAGRRATANALATVDGLATAGDRTSPGLLPTAQEVFEDLCRLGLVELRAGRYCPTERGWLVGNELYGRIWALQDTSEG